jgi:hypothetical protein
MIGSPVCIDIVRNPVRAIDGIVVPRAILIEVFIARHILGVGLFPLSVRQPESFRVVRMFVSRRDRESVASGTGQRADGAGA